MTAEDNAKAGADGSSNNEKEDGAGDGGSPEDEETKQRKRKERLEQNRVSARESRKRKKTMIEELQRTVITLSRENKDLNDRNEGLRRQLMEIGSKVSSFEKSYWMLGWCSLLAVLQWKMELLSVPLTE